MFSKFLKLNLILFFLTSTSFAEVVKKIDIKNNLRISDETIKVLGNFDIGDDLSKNDLNKILKNLYTTDFFKDLTISLENNILNIDVLENSIIQSIFIKGIKKKDLTAKLSENLSVKEKSSYKPFNIEKDRSFILNSLKSLGYYFVDVNSQVVFNLNNTVNIVYDVNLGDRANIKKINFTGNKIFKDRKLKTIITSEESKIWKFLSSSKYLDQQRVNLDIRLLTNYYKNNGYYNVKIETFTAELLDNNNFELSYNIDAGKKFFFNDFNLILPDDFEKIYFKKIEIVFDKLKNKPYSLNRIEEILDEIDKVALSKQYEFLSADVEEIIIEKNKLNFDIYLKETEKFYVQRINILGNTVTQESVLRNKFLVDEGDAYNELLHNKTINKLKALRIFKSVESEVVEGDTPDQKIVNIEIEEKPTGEISAGAGVGTTGGSLAFSIKENNYMGTGVKLNSQVNIDDNSIKGVLSATIPNYKYSDNSLVASVRSSVTDKLTDHGYKTGKTGFSVGTNYEQYEDFYISPSIFAFHESLETNNNASSNLKKQEGSYTDIFLDYAITYDKRNQAYQATDGFRSSFSQKLPVYSQNYAIVNGYTFSSYHKLAKEMTGTFSLYTKAVNALSDEDVRVSERLQVPANKLRGFQRGKIGPYDNGYVGGNYVTALNLSTNLPTVLPTLENIDFKFFFDAANVWGVDYSSQINNSNAIRTSTGIGIDWFTPIGPLSFSLAQPLTFKDSDKTETFRFSLGTTF